MWGASAVHSVMGMSENGNIGTGDKPRMPRWKRTLLILGSLVAGFALVIGGLFTWLYTGAKVSTVGAVDFHNALAVPPLAASTVEADGTRVFDLRMQAGRPSSPPGRGPRPGVSTAATSAPPSARRRARRSG